VRVKTVLFVHHGDKRRISLRGATLELLHGLRIKDVLNLTGKAVFILWLVSWAVALFGGHLLGGELQQWGWMGVWIFTAYLVGLLIWNLGARVISDNSRG
jgi:hypothetical protein